jgi:H+-transporting ATPase
MDNKSTGQYEDSSTKRRSTAEYKAISVGDTLGLLATAPDGLSESEAKRRLQLFGRNEVVTKKRSPIVEFLSRFWGPMPWLLELAIVLSCILGHYLEAGIIFLLLAINAVIGHIQARGSQRALEALVKRLAIKANILRDGKWTVQDASKVIPGDIIAIGLGDIVPADAKIASGEVSVDQSALTGESLLVDLRESALVYSGSIVKQGKAKCVVINTGADTYFGRTAELVKIAKPKSHQEQIMMGVVRYMMYLGVAALAMVTIYAILMGTGVLSILTFAVIFLMGAVPVALPAVLTIVQAVGATELAKKGVLVTRLDSIEDAASIDVLCLDKTGTITQNRLSVADVIPFSGYSEEDVIAAASLSSQELGKDAIDTVVLEYAKDAKVNLDAYQQVSFTPFDPAIKRSEAIISTDGGQFKVIKGAPQTVTSLCQESDETREEANRLVEELSRKGYRTLAVARSDSDFDNVHLVGLLSLGDPPRADSKEMIAGVRALGVKPIMLTGDNIAIAREIASQVAIGNRIIRMEDLTKLSEEQQARRVEESDGFAEIYPEDKYRIVKLLQSQGHMVGMTGDGVNDAPVLKQAEMGIAVSGSTDVAKASASVVLTEPGIAVIVDALKTSRHIYQRMLTWVINKVTKVIQVVGLLTIGFFWFHDVVVSLLGMALLIFANDFVTMSLATDNVKYTASPNKWDIRNITFASLVVGALLVGEGALTLFIGSHYFHLEWEPLRTFTLLMLIFTSQFRVYIVRERKFFWSSRPGRELLISTTAAIIVFALLGVYGIIISPLTPFQVLFLIGFSALFTFAIDIPKYISFQRFGL